MKPGFPISLFLLIFLLNACWIKEAPRSSSREVNIVADYLSPADSALIRDFGKNFRVKVSFSVVSPDSIFERFRKQPFNTGIDILITEDESLRNRLRIAGTFKKLDDDALFAKAERQFYQPHRLWSVICHNPLVLATQKDTSGHCNPLNRAAWHTSDSLRPKLQPGAATGRYFKQLTDDFPQLTDKKRRIAPGEAVYTLSELVERNESRDSISELPSRPCYRYLVRGKQYVTSITTISVTRYSQNPVFARAFIVYFDANSISAANGRNQLPAKKNARPNWYIQQLNVQ